MAGIPVARFTCTCANPRGVAVVDRRGGSGSDLSLFDTTGDDKPNLVGIDTTGDGNVDTIAVESTRDGRISRGRIDSTSSAGVDVETIQLVDLLYLYAQLVAAPSLSFRSRCLKIKLLKPREQKVFFFGESERPLATRHSK